MSLVGRDGFIVISCIDNKTTFSNGLRYKLSYVPAFNGIEVSISTHRIFFLFILFFCSDKKKFL